MTTPKMSPAWRSWEKPPQVAQLQRKPRKGDRIGFGKHQSGPWNPLSMVQATCIEEPMWPTMTVLHVDGYLCWVTYDDKSPSGPFIWYFASDNTRNALARIFGDDGQPIEHTPPEEP